MPLLAVPFFHQWQDSKESHYNLAAGVRDESEGLFSFLPRIYRAASDCFHLRSLNLMACWRDEYSVRFPLRIPSGNVTQRNGIWIKRRCRCGCKSGLVLIFNNVPSEGIVHSHVTVIVLPWTPKQSRDLSVTFLTVWTRTQSRDLSVTVPPLCTLYKNVQTSLR